VPIEAAREHYRLVPHSELLTLPGDHFLVVTKADSVGSSVNAFVHRVAAGNATRRANADPERIRRATLLFGSVRLPRVRGTAAAVFAGLLIVTSLLSETFGTAAAGMLVVSGRLSLAFALGSRFIAMLVITLRGNLGTPADVRRIARSCLTSVARAVVLVGAAAVVSWILFRLAPAESMASDVRRILTVALVASVVRVGLAISTERNVA